MANNHSGLRLLVSSSLGRQAPFLLPNWDEWSFAQNRESHDAAIIAEFDPSGNASLASTEAVWNISSPE